VAPVVDVEHDNPDSGALSPSASQQCGSRRRQSVVTPGGRRYALQLGLAATLTASSIAACSSSPGIGRATPTTSACVARSLRAHGGRQGASGAAHGDLDITNVAGSPCTLGAPQSITVLTADRRALDVRLRPATATLQPVTVPPGGVARLTLAWSNWCHAAPGPLTISVTLPGPGGTISGPFDGPPDYDYVPPCLERNDVSVLQLLALSLRN
jgi:hypothetical protein